MPSNSPLRLRQLGHPIHNVRHTGNPAHPAGKYRGYRPGEQVHGPVRDRRPPIPWNTVDDYAALGSLTLVDPTVRRKAIDHNFEWSDDLFGAARIPQPSANNLGSGQRDAFWGRLAVFETLSYFRVKSEPSSGDGIWTEYFVPIVHASAALGAVGSLAEALMVTELRTVAGDRLWLSRAEGRDSLATHFP